jgi:hypothetical protein
VGLHIVAQHKQRRLEANPFPDAIYVRWLQGLPQLPEHLGPASASWTNSIAVCATMKDENVTDVREWLHYYKCVLMIPEWPSDTHIQRFVTFFLNNFLVKEGVGLGEALLLGRLVVT